MCLNVMRLSPGQGDGRLAVALCQQALLCLRACVWAGYMCFHTCVCVCVKDKPTDREGERER